MATQRVSPIVKYINHLVIYSCKSSSFSIWLSSKMDKHHFESIRKFSVECATSSIENYLLEISEQNIF